MSAVSNASALSDGSTAQSRSTSSLETGTEPIEIRAPTVALLPSSTSYDNSTATPSQQPGQHQPNHPTVSSSLPIAVPVPDRTDSRNNRADSFEAAQPGDVKLEI